MEEGRSMTTKHDVIAAHKKHPELHSSDLARILGCASEYVRATAKRNNLKLPKGTRLAADPRGYAKDLRLEAAKLIARAAAIEAAL